MRKLFFFAVMLLFAATACESEVNNTDNSGATDSRVTEDVMDMLINDLLMGVFTPYNCEVMDGDKCVKPWEETIFGTVGAKFADLGTGNRIVFYNDGTCRMGYTSGLYSNCEQVIKDPEHPKALYDTWQWSYDAAAATITLIAEDLAPSKDPKTTVKVVSYEDGWLMIDGELPNSCIAPYTYKYKCLIEGAAARRDFESIFKYDEEDYPCCAQ